MLGKEIEHILPFGKKYVEGTPKKEIDRLKLKIGECYERGLVKINYSSQLRLFYFSVFCETSRCQLGATRTFSRKHAFFFFWLCFSDACQLIVPFSLSLFFFWFAPSLQTEWKNKISHPRLCIVVLRRMQSRFRPRSQAPHPPTHR
jgi:hypothetical protein